MATQVKIIIDKKSGKVKFDYNGFVGEACFEAAEKLKELLRSKFGVEVKDEEVVRKPEAYIAEEEQEKQGLMTW